MNIEEIREYCLGKPGVTESFPFDETTLVFKVMGKIFCLLNLDGEPGLLLKNSPEKVIDLQERYSFVLPGYHMSKVHWIRVMVDQAGDDRLITTWIDESYSSVVGGLPRKLQQELIKLEKHDGI
ncbi:MAG TPA: MmcQ/YjbR family DNA-binding protein [Prolixibacteraceae bacterium]|mgnify:CR=1 FL=1|nr:MmcQ/YjbR family DNA-binding protein [Prolixibacteraceae bacterium]